MLHVFTTSGFSVVAASSPPPLLDHYRRHAELHDRFVLNEPAGYLFLGAGPAAREWPVLLIEQQYSPGVRSGFNPGVHIVEESATLFVGAGTQLLVYDVALPRRLYEGQVELGFWSWQQHGSLVLMSAELELAAFDRQGTKLWSKFVEPPWHYTVAGDLVDLNIMGNVTRFPISHGQES